MSKRVALLMAALALAIGWVAFSFQQSLRPPAPMGTTVTQSANQPVEDFALKDENGQTVRLSNYKGQIVALVFYASW
jgi:cytochrome oxidase Cu insertion factor (SCO1/SenC/PrrC family)